MADIYASRMIEYASKGGNRKALEYTGETLDFGLPFAPDPEGELARFVTSEGLTVGETAFLGRSTKKGTFLAVTEFRVDTTHAPRLP
ncbi:MAG: hypothetical protein OEO79_13715 [Gemmatimonadota bacterium]|nr:hypothetical protein [Gemmatimonadota bacterium]